MSESARSVPQGPPAVVHVDGMALLKVIKHCHESLPALASGTLLGLHQDDTLEVSDCFVQPFRTEAEEQEDETSQDMPFEEQMLQLLKETNVDNNVVGQFQATYLSCNVFSMALLESQYELQRERGASQVCVVYDPMQTANGTLTVKAYRVSDAFMGLLDGGDFSHAALAASGFEGHQVMEEVPVRLHNSHLVTALMLELTAQQDTSAADFDRLDLVNHPFLEKSVQFANSWVDELATETNKQQHYQKTVQRQKQEAQRWLNKRRAENEERRETGLEPLSEDIENAPVTGKAVPEPSRLEALLLTHQIDRYCEQINRFAGVGLGKLFLASSLQA